MKKLVSVLLLLLLGVGVLIPTQSTFAQIGLDLNRYCSDKGWGIATLNGGNTAYDWRCQSGSTYHEMSISEACQMQYGTGYVAEYRNFNNPNSWYCQALANGGSGNQQNPEPGPNPVTRPNDQPPPSPTVNITTCVNSYFTGVQVGGQARVTPGVANRIRSGAGTGYSQVGSARPGVVFDVIGGPTCADGYKWWRINYNGTVGWTVEGDNSEAWIEVSQSSVSLSDLGRSCEAMASASLSAYSVRRCAESAFNGLPDDTLMVNFTVASLECVAGIGPDTIQSLISNLQYYGVRGWREAILMSVGIDTPQSVGECLVDLGSTFFE